MGQEITQDTLFKLYIACVLDTLEYLKVNKEQVR